MPQAIWSHCFICLQEMKDTKHPHNECTNFRKHQYHESCLEMWRKRSNSTISDMACIACYHREHNCKFDRYDVGLNNTQNTYTQNTYTQNTYHTQNTYLYDDEVDADDPPNPESTKIIVRKCSICRQLYNINNLKEYEMHSHKDKKVYNIPVMVKLLEANKIHCLYVNIDYYDTIYDLKCIIENTFNLMYPFRLLYKGREIDGNTDLVSTYDIKGDSVVYVVLIKDPRSSYGARNKSQTLRLLEA